MREANWQKYLIVFFITAAIFATAISVSAYLSDRRIKEVRDIEDKIAIDILSAETQFNLLAEASCEDAGISVLSQELNSLAAKLSYAESTRGADDEEVIKLKRFYSLLEIKDYLLLKRVSAKCGESPLVILYFYSNEEACEDCERMGYVLTKLREDYPDLRVYSFDYNLDLSAVNTLIATLNVRAELPALVVKGKAYYGFKSLEEFDVLLPELVTLRKEQEKEKQTGTSTDNSN